MMNKLNPIIYLIFIISFLGCSTSHTISNSPDLNTTNTERNISSESESISCVNLLNKFLPEFERNKLHVTTNAFASNNKLVQEVEKKISYESVALFNSFEKEVKDLSTQGEFKLLVDPHEALLTRLMLIKKAKTTIDLTYYIFQDSETSKILLDELRQALRRGVNVRLMVDGSGSMAATANFYKEIQVLAQTVGGKILDENGNAIGKAKFDFVEINPMFNLRASVKKWYNKVMGLVTGKPVATDDFYMFHRSHDKILMIDANSPENSMAIIGGRNISNHYYKIGTEAERDSTFNDLDILVKNIAFTTNDKDNKAVIRNILAEHFNRLYLYSANKNFENFIFKLSRGKSAQTLKTFKKARTELLSDNSELGSLLDKMEKDKFLENGYDKGWISFLDEIENLTRKNPLKKAEDVYDNNQNSVIKNMWVQIEKAEKDILICSPYVYLTDKEIATLTSWLKADPSRTFRLITNSSATSDNLFAQSMVESFVMPKLLKEFKDNGITDKQFEVLAYGNLDNKEFGGRTAQGKLHAKYWMIDNYAIGVGTSNFDPISRLTNSEVMANVFPTEGTQSVESINKYYASLKASSTKWDSPDFLAAKFRPELKNKLMIQSFIAKVLSTFNILPQ